MFSQLLARALCLCFGCAVVALAVAFASGCSTDTFIAPNGDGGLMGDVLQPDAFGLKPDAEDGSSASDVQSVDVSDAWTDAFDGNVGPAFRRVFISSGKWTANLGGVSGADSLCQSAAAAAGLGGKWMAWVSTSTSSPKTRFVHSAVPWQLLDGTVIANDWADLTSGSLEHNIDRDENNVPVVWSGSLMTGITWTSTYGDGSSMLSHGSSSDCSGFTDGTSMSTSAYAGVGYIGYTTGYQSDWWSDAQGGGTGYDCVSSLSLYCFEQ